MQNTIEKSLLSVQGISPLRFDNEPLLRHSFPANAVQYSLSFLYLLRASHGDNGSNGFKYVTDEVTAVIGYRHNLVYIIPIKDTTKGLKLQELCCEIATKIYYPIIIKKFSQEIYPYMKNIRKYALHNNLREEGAYDETKLILQNLFITPQAELSPKAMSFRKTVRRFQKQGLHFEKYDEITKVPQQKIEKFLNQDSEKYANYSSMIKYLYRNGGNDKYKIMVFLYRDIVQGLYITEFLSKKDVGLYCAVTTKDKQGITEWLDWYFFRKLFLSGIETIYFGGAETEGVEHYIKKLLPDKPTYSIENVEYSILS